MEDETLLSPESLAGEGGEEVVVETPVSEDVKTPPNPAPQSGEKTVPYSRFKEINDELKRLKEQPPKVVKNLGVEDYIDISAALEGLDQREKTYLAREHKLTGMPLDEIRKSEDFSLWQSAYREKVEKERLTLEPSSKQSEADKPKSLTEKLASAISVEEKEKILAEAGLYKSPRVIKDRTQIKMA